MTFIPKSPAARAAMERKLARQAAEAEAVAAQRVGEGAPPKSEYPELVEGLSFTSGTSSQESAALRQAQGERCGAVADAQASDAGSSDVQGSAPPPTPFSEEEGALGASTSPSDIPNLPALIAEIPSDDTRPAQTQFDLAAQTVFLEALATSGSVRSASRKARTSHQSVYRMRRASRPFKRAWDAALVVAREAAACELADRAMNGVEEPVFYHGEEIARRRRYDSRLLLAHLARLDRLAETEDAAALAEDFDGMLERFGCGEAHRTAITTRSP